MRISIFHGTIYAPTERSKLTGSPPLDMERKPAPIQLKILQQRAELVWGVTPHEHHKNIRQGRQE